MAMTCLILNNLTSMYETIKSNPSKIWIQKDFIFKTNNIKQYIHTLHHLGLIEILQVYAVTGKKLTARKLTKGFRLKKVENGTKV